ncbi:hypothetical protein PFISCL1PPCAC_4251, partial [Pristionchus fissidentatus]
ERQRSPTALDTVVAVPGLSRDELRFEYGSQPSAIDCRDHHGHWEVRLNGLQKLHIDYLNETFVLQQFHAHWGHTVDQEGSEHILNGRRTTAEIHFVHRNIRYATMKEALGKPAGLVVLAVFVEAINNWEQLHYRTSEFRAGNQFSILADLVKARNKMERLKYLWRIRPQNLIPANSPFLHYTGSLTFNERGPVEWVVYEKTLKVRREHLAFLYEYGPENWNELHEIRNDTVIYRTLEEFTE